jgi:A/G-specific adenine glycosylase
MAAFPDLPALAGASEDDVMAHWSGLGYYARARNILKTARACVAEHGGRLPADADELAALPGIGRSTANAIVSQAFDAPRAVLDGNVRRVLARHTGTRGWTGSAKVQKTLWREAESRLPSARGADYTQAVMDLGALVCTRSNPNCHECPVAGDCIALRDGLVDQLPTPKPPARVGRKTLRVLIARDEQGRVLLEKRPGAGIWGGLWCLPEATPGHAGFQAVHELPALEHRLSHLQLTIEPLLARPATGKRIANGAEQGWFDRHEQARLGLPKPVSDLLDRLDKGEFT